MPEQQPPSAPWPCQLIDRFSQWIGTLLFWLPLGMVLITAVNILLRYVFQQSSPAAQEAVLYLHSAIIALTAGYTLQRNGHVRIDFLYTHFTLRQRAWVDLLGTLVFLLPFCLILFSYCLHYVAQSWSVHETSLDAQGLPFVWLQKSLLLALPALLLLQGLSLALSQAALLLQTTADSTKPHV